MDDYIVNLRLKWNHPDPKKCQLSPYKYTPIVYGSKIQYSVEPPFSPTLGNKGIFRVQSIAGALLCYAQSVDNKLLVGLNDIVQKQASSTEDTNSALLQILDYVAPYPNDGILCRASVMVLSGDSDASYLNVR